jgi:hypothetical protein
MSAPCNTIEDFTIQVLTRFTDTVLPGISAATLLKAELEGLESTIRSVDDLIMQLNLKPEDIAYYDWSARRTHYQETVGQMSASLEKMVKTVFEGHDDLTETLERFGGDASCIRTSRIACEELFGAQIDVTRIKDRS